MNIGRKRFALNTIATLMSFFTNIGISFFIVPYIVNIVGSEAYGFVGLSNNFVSYAAVITIALSSMISRFVTISIHQNDSIRANKYFNSSLISNMVIAVVLLVPATLCVFFLEKVVNVPSPILVDIQILFACTFLGFFLNLFSSTFATATFAQNRLDISATRDIIANVIRIILLAVLFVFFKPSVSYLGIATAVTALFVFVTNYHFMKKYLPDISIDKRFFDFKAVKEMISSGIWNTITRLSQLLLEGLDLLIANLAISATAMGTLAIAKTLPMFIASFILMFGGIFLPKFTILYAQNNQQELLKSIKNSMKVTNFVVSIPIAILLVFGDVFYSLWMPSQDADLLKKLSIIIAIGFIFSGSINSIYAVFTITNKLKVNSIFLLISGIINVLIVYMLIKTTSLGVYAIAGVSTVLGIVRETTFLPIYGSKCLGVKWNTFYPEIFKSIISVATITSIAYIYRWIFEVDGWGGLLISGIICSFVGVIINLYINFNKAERLFLLKNTLKRLK
ncbi:hypothetical protein COD05_24275 [Bacillus cereus]|uniref:lipopolysaccharide biosynthesis protein n=1 Tax=Bacillus sp. AW TaxID=2293329 RepID=UPI000BF3B05C|nr:oligosaccharide flippase family protein [Bacillus wiedmannii]PFI47450.1 hypothetical protein COI76_26600 [Bacillus cereus]RFB70556.1 hypothetical protein DZB94_22535 [Bacillus sp. AW]PFQ94743.1 hypothetical protein COK28_03100 [Bacillus cereus]PGP34917.1 hypothetical protein CN989_19030 [Bacillus cereus]